MPKLQYKHYLLILLTVVAAFNFLDRYVLSLMLEPIKQEFALSDSQLGFLTGFAFALFYAVAGIPIARWADRGNRITIVSVTTLLWSAMVALAGLVGNFTQLLLVRIGVAVGEAGCLPPAQSLIADHFDRSERPWAMSIYWTCGPIAVVVGYLCGGWLIESFGWRITFVLIGIPGILLALLVRLKLHEPRLRQTAVTVVIAPCFKDVVNTLWQKRTFRYLITAFCVTYFFSMGIMQWLPTFFIRSHAMGVGELGTWLAVAWGLCGVIGTYLGGALAARYASQNEAMQMRGCALIFAMGSALFIMVFFSSNKYQALAFMAATAFELSIVTGVVFAAIQSLVNDHMRSVAVALILLFANLIGLGLGPIAVGVLSDALMPIFGQESLRYALVLLSPGFLLVAFYYWKAGGTIEADIRRVELEARSVAEQMIMSERDSLELSNAHLGNRS